MRWVMRLAEFDLDIQHRKGKKSTDVDGMTRDPPENQLPYGPDIETLYDSVEQTVAMARSRGTKRKAEAKSEVPDLPAPPQTAK